MQVQSHRGDLHELDHHYRYRPRSDEVPSDPAAVDQAGLREPTMLGRPGSRSAITRPSTSSGPLCMRRRAFVPNDDPVMAASQLHSDLWPFEGLVVMVHKVVHLKNPMFQKN